MIIVDLNKACRSVASVLVESGGHIEMIDGVTAVAHYFLRWKSAFNA